MAIHTCKCNYIGICMYICIHTHGIACGDHFGWRDKQNKRSSTNLQTDRSSNLEAFAPGKHLAYLVCLSYYSWCVYIMLFHSSICSKSIALYIYIYIYIYVNNQLMSRIHVHGLLRTNQTDGPGLQVKTQSLPWESSNWDRPSRELANMTADYYLEAGTKTHAIIFASSQIKPTSFGSARLDAKTFD